MATNYRAKISTQYYTGSSNTVCKDIFSDETLDQITTINDISLKNSPEHHIKIGFTCSTFDLLHPGHIIMLKDAKDQCDILVVGIQHDPTIDRPDDKNKPIQTLKERRIMLESCRWVDHIIEYSTENDLYNILKNLNPDVRILGSDWKGKQYTGYELSDIKIYWHDRSNHDYSTTNLRKRIYHAELFNKKS